ncbi:hypothetical protein BpHYR1_035061 [Brachionus plicatilis]|uniref:Uncharacterized protein n=1 Tax=Brachionus plicatilis TaxID=10195 RepID=A0A3M7SZ31_BRAPC|nr:hypothetical protein BpHYR1_035061 [Brachionus plicatilis]
MMRNLINPKNFKNFNFMYFCSVGLIRTTIFIGFNKNVTQKKPRPNNGQYGRPSRPVCGSEPADLSDLAGRPKRPRRPI